MIHTHYDNLKVAHNAPPEVIRAAYKSLALKFHPDRNPENSEATRIMAIINASYNVLSDTEKRQQHDKWIARRAAEKEAKQKSAACDSIHTNSAACDSIHTNSAACDSIHTNSAACDSDSSTARMIIIALVAVVVMYLAHFALKSPSKLEPPVVSPVVSTSVATELTPTPPAPDPSIAEARDKSIWEQDQRFKEYNELKEMRINSVAGSLSALNRKLHLLPHHPAVTNVDDPNGCFIVDSSDPDMVILIANDGDFVVSEHQDTTVLLRKGKPTKLFFTVMYLDSNRTIVTEWKDSDFKMSK